MNMEKKIIDIKTISTTNEEKDPTNAWYKHSFNGQVEEILKLGYVPYDEVKVTYSHPYKDATGGMSFGNYKFLTQQFVKYEQ